MAITPSWITASTRRIRDNWTGPSLAQTFADNATNSVSTSQINHLQSKSCGGETGGDIDILDGQGCWNAARTAAARNPALRLYGDPRAAVPTAS
ncbi:MAG: hypothetical protein IPJ94_29145 [Chloroflexi bacterium]|nr:hypothetical protein [Chloroflexota bacterium]